MPYEDVIRLDQDRPGFLDGALEDALSEIYSRLRKRYRTPMNPLPGIVKKWRAKLVTPQAYAARGVNPEDPTVKAMDEEADRAREQMKEAADAKDGLYDLPLLDNADATAIDKGGPLGYSEPSPYDSQDRQAEAIRGR